MKKILTIISVLCAFAAVSAAENVSSSKARDIAYDFFFGKDATETKAVSLNMVWDGSKPATKSSTVISSAPAFYVFNSSCGGYVIISAENSVKPIIGYSREGSFDKKDIPDGLDYWLEGVRDNIYSARSEGRAQTPEVAAAWKSVGVATKAKGVGGKRLNTPTWYQSAPFNALLETKVAGCVPTSLAIVMRYYQWPSSPEAVTIPATSNHPALNLSGHTYNFAAMPYSVSEVNAASQDVKDDIAELYRDIGYAMDVAYGYSATSGYSQLIIERMGTYFKYNKGASRKDRAFYSESNWISMLKASIDADIPVLYDGVDPAQGGHAFVVDGYDEDNFMHFSFGWGGYLDGYFAVGANTFYEDQSAIFNFTPDYSGTSSFGNSELYLDYSDYTKEWIGAYTDGEVTKNQYFTLYIGAIANHGPLAYTGSIQPYFRTRNGDYEEAVRPAFDPITVELTGMKMSTGSGCAITHDIGLGDRFVIKYQYGGGWREMEDNYGGEISYSPVIKAGVIDLPASCSVGQTLEMRLTNAPYRWSDRCEWYVTAPGGTETLLSPGIADTSLDSNDRYYYNFGAAGTYKIKVVVKDHGGSTCDIIRTTVKAL